MPYNNTTYSAAKTQRDALRNTLFTFATSTLPSAVASTASAVAAIEGHPMLESTAHEDVRFYRACVQYVNELKANGRYTGPALTYP